MASSDNHSARPGTGYKEVARVGMTDERALASALAGLAASLSPPPAIESLAVDPSQAGMGVANAERQAGFWSTGGLVAVHAKGRHREAIWAALQRREVYGTSGPRILLWFELMNAPDGLPRTMGSEVEIADSPRFRARATGSAEPLPGCPAASVAALGADEIERLCLGECYRPSDRRRVIDRIEVVRIRPGDPEVEPLAQRIEDPWRVLKCSGDEAGCSLEFEDADFTGASGEVVYYVRAIERESPTIHGDGSRCAERGDDCLAPAEHRAWSSPIFVRPARPARPARTRSTSSP